MVDELIEKRGFAGSPRPLKNDNSIQRQIGDKAFKNGALVILKQLRRNPSGFPPRIVEV
jgi:hypothetical protein